MPFTSPVIRKQISMLHYTYYVTPLSGNYVIPLMRPRFVCITQISTGHGLRWLARLLWLLVRPGSLQCGD